MAWAGSRFWLSVNFPSAVPTRRPAFKTSPSAQIRPVSGMTGRSREIFNSKVVDPRPWSNVNCTASATAESSKIVASPLCTPLAGLRWSIFGVSVTISLPSDVSTIWLPNVRAMVLRDSAPETRAWKMPIRYNSAGRRRLGPQIVLDAVLLSCVVLSGATVAHAQDRDNGDVV